MDTNYSTYNRDLQMQQQQQEQTAAIAVLVVVGLVIGTAVALLVGQANARKKQRTFRGRLEHGLGEGLESTKETVQRLEKEFKELRKRVESGIGDLR
jgi:predicted RNase H-like nuclease (RuvC/YqgF family)